MKNLLVFREQLKKFYGNNSMFIDRAFRFLFALIAFWAINHSIGFMTSLSNPLILVGLALICMFLPVNATVLISAALILANLYKLSIEIMAVTGAIMLIMFILYFRFVPKQAFVLILTPIACALKIPYVIPVALGLAATPISMVSVGCGVIIYYIIHYATVYAAGVSASTDTDAVSKVTYFAQNVLQNKQMWVTVMAFAIVVAVVYAIRRQSIDHSWSIAIVVGILLNFVIFVIGNIVLNVKVDYAMLIFGSILSLLIALALQLFLFTVDYSRTKYVQYEDDEYYYYVKAVPKISIAAPEKKVKRISHRYGSQMEENREYMTEKNDEELEKEIEDSLNTKYYNNK